MRGDVMNKRGFTVLAMAFLIQAGLGTVAGAAPPGLKQWQMARLLDPSDADRKAEEKGRVMIYDGMTDREVARALDEHFDRIEYMMFTRTVVTDHSGEPRKNPESGELVTESTYDDGCD